MPTNGWLDIDTPNHSLTRWFKACHARIYTLRNKFLLSALVISILTAMAYMLAVSWVIHEQYLHQSNRFLQKAFTVITDNLAERKANLLSASQKLATQGNLGDTIWYLEQYACSNLDRETFSNTYQKLARETQKTGYASNVAKIAIYNSAGRLVAFALFDDKEERVGFVESCPVTQFQIAELKRGEEISATKLRAADSVPRINPNFTDPLPMQDSARYAVVDGLVSIESHVPIIGETFNPTTGLPKTQQVGLIVMVQPLDHAFVSQISRLTDTEINVFTRQGFSSGSIASYIQPDRSNGEPVHANGPTSAIQFNEIKIQGVGYYQELIPLYADDKPIGSIATLHSKASVEKNIREMKWILWLIAAASLAFVIPFAWYFATSISRPLTILSRIFRGVASGGRTALLDEELKLLDREDMRYGEIGDLTRSFVAMNDAIRQKICQINEINTSLENTIHQRTAALIAKEQESRTLIDHSPDTIARYDRECRRIYANPALIDMMGYSLDKLLGTRPSEIPGGPDSELYETKIRAVLASGKNDELEMKWIGKNGKELFSHIRLTVEAGLSGEVATVLAVGRDITDRKEFEAVIWKQANFDVLTHLPNRQMFYDRLEYEAKKSNRLGRSMALMLIDLDRFKEINDTLGHDKGDLLLVEAARRISFCVRESDTVARLGGDEFTVILSCLDNVESIERIALSILTELSKPFILGVDEAFITASVGITMYPNDARELDVLFKNADQAMYAAKAAGRNGFSYFTPGLQEAAQIRLSLTGALRLALADGQFQVYYQPIVNLTTGQIGKAEALIRWQHREHGMISPMEFIPLAEETGLIVTIGDWVFKQVVRQVRQWRSRFDGSFQISINKSPAQFRYDDAAFVQWPEYLKQQGMPGQSIVIEITEGLLLNAESKIKEKLLFFRDAGIQISIDDFGTGYSPLAYLKCFGIDYLKIDRSFVHNLDTDADNQALCEAIIVMAHKLGLKVIAEGVETIGQRDFICAAGCDFAQGYLYSKAMTPEQFEQWAWPDA